MGPLAKEDIKKFHEKLMRIDKDLDKINKARLAASVEFLAIRDEMNLLSDKRKALDQTYNCMIEQIQVRKQAKCSSIKNMFKKGIQ